MISCLSLPRSLSNEPYDILLDPWEETVWGSLFTIELDGWSELWCLVHVCLSSISP